MSSKMLTPQQEKMFEENIGLVYSTINRYVSHPGEAGLNDYEDLAQIGSMALCHAIKTYDQGKGAVFSTYATTVIKNRLYNATRDGRDVWLDTADDIEDVMIENSASLVYNNINKAEDVFAEKEQDEVLLALAEKYGGIAGKGVKAIILMMKGYSCDNIAEMYKTKPSTVSSWMSRARSKLKKEPEILRLLAE